MHAHTHTHKKHKLHLVNYTLPSYKAKLKSTGDIASPSFLPFWRGITHACTHAQTHTHTHNINFILLTTLSLYTSKILLSFTTLVLNMWVVVWVTIVGYIPRNMVKNFVPSITPQELRDVYIYSNKWPTATRTSADSCAVRPKISFTHCMWGQTIKFQD